MGISETPGFLLTAGLGTRLRPFTETKPKPCIPFLNIPLFAYSYYLCKQAGLGPYFFNLHYQPQKVEANIRETLPAGQKISFFDESKKILGSGGALWNAKKELEKFDQFLVANGDEVLIPSDPKVLNNLLQSFQQHRPLAHLLVTDHPELLKTLKPVWINQHNEVVGFGMDKPPVDCQPVHYTGYKIFSREIFSQLPDGESNIFYDVLVRSIAQGKKVTVFRDNELSWFETGNIKSYIEATHQCLELLNKEHPYLLSLMKFYGQNPRDYVLEKNKKGWIYRHRDTFLPHTTQCEGVVSLERGTNVGIRGHLTNVIADKDAKIPDNAELVNQIVFKA